MKSGNLNFLEPSWLLQACNGTALPFYKYETRIRINSLPTPPLFEFKKEEASEKFRVMPLHIKATWC